MGACHWERAQVLQRVHDLKRQLDQVREREPENRTAIEQAGQELLRASQALARLPDCSE